MSPQPPPRPPRATYRLQLRSGVTLATARDLVPYLDALGIRDLYLSPIFAARSGSTHGYDVVDPNRIDPSLGTDDDLCALSDALGDAGMGLIIDIVPNHMSASTENRWWRDVLQHGPHSDFADFFDIDWEPAGHPELHGKVVLPMLGAELDDVIAGGELTVETAEAGDGSSETALRYFETELPLAPGTEPSDLGRLAPSDVHQLLAEQHYVLDFWRTGTRRVNWRRFFGLTELVGVRVEDPAVFEATHALVVRLVEEGVVSGLRVDHVDGLRDPQEYLERLQARCGGEAPHRLFPIVVEKILGHGEHLPDAWPVLGTTGYEFIDAANGLFVDAAGLARVRSVYERFVGEQQSFAALVESCKRRMLDELFPADLERIVTRRAADEGNAADGAHDRGVIRRALVDETLALDVYRTYRRGADTPAWVLDWQQLTGGVTAKAVEDTAFYASIPLMSLNEVGCHPDARRSDPVSHFHRAAEDEALRWPHGLKATSTHDTKLGEDARVRIDVLSEIPDEWQAALDRWHERTEHLRSTIDGRSAPEPIDEIRLYQALLGIWPATASGDVDPGAIADVAERLRAYLTKAAREAKRRTSWHDVDEAYESVLAAFVDGVTGDADLLADIGRFARRIAWHGMLNGLAQVVLKTTSPGVPDLYQGTELWDLSLVDPDNRRPIDFDLRRQFLDELLLSPVPSFDQLDAWYDGCVKLGVTIRALRARRLDVELFAVGAYLPLRVTGERADHVVAFIRRVGGRWAFVVVPRLTSSLSQSDEVPCGSDVWLDTEIVLPDDAPYRWTDAVSGHLIAVGDPSKSGAPTLRLADILARFPVAIYRGYTPRRRPTP